ncbi:methylenetetrahydrofolate reductase C-terminal domain-containing protein, partial [Bacteroidota bacterium]
MKKLRELFNEKDKFLIGTELVSSRGILQQQNNQKVVNLARELSNDNRVDWVSFTENPGGNPMIAPDILGKIVLQNNKNVILNITCKDVNRNSLESLAWKYASEGFENVLALSGDYPIDGYNGLAQPVFDIDSAGLLQMLKEMNQGLKINGRKPGDFINLDKTDFFAGCTVSPFKYSEAEQMMQYQKLLLKLQTGADFIITQLGYNIRKSEELLYFLRENNIKIPVIGNIYRLTPGIARMFNKNMFPGCVVSDELLARINKEKTSADKGKAFFTEFAAKQLIAFKNLGYNGVYIGGFNNYNDFDSIIKKADELKEENWTDFIPELTNPFPGEFYYYSSDDKTKLSDTTKINPVYEGNKRSPYSKYVSIGYRINRVFHSLVFSKKSPIYTLNKKKYSILEKKPNSIINRFHYFNERSIKGFLFNCKECGDCSLPEITYLCPQSQCVKNQRNGPCGGSYQNKCEHTDKNKDCIWVKAYSRNKYYYGNKNPLLNRKVIIKDNSLKDTSGWSNYFLAKGQFKIQKAKVK